VFQEVSLLAIEKGCEVTDESQLKIWLRHVARYKSLEAARQMKRRPAPLSESVIDKLEAHWVQNDSTPESELVEILRECIRLLAPNGRKLMVLRYTKGLRTSQITEQLKRPFTTVRRAIARAHRSLHDCVRAKLAAKNQSHHDE
jgi:RNA polymerase sigma-70 factor, ECF subfamily